MSVLNIHIYACIYKYIISVRNSLDNGDGVGNCNEISDLVCSVVSFSSNNDVSLFSFWRLHCATINEHIVKWMNYCPLHILLGTYIIFWKLRTRYESINLPIALSQPKVICSSLFGSLVFGTSSWFSRIFVCAEHFNFFFLRVLSLTRLICMSLLWLGQTNI